jgi:hypothetical protein
VANNIFRAWTSARATRSGGYSCARLNRTKRRLLYAYLHRTEAIDEDSRPEAYAGACAVLSGDPTKDLWIGRLRTPPKAFKAIARIPYRVWTYEPARVTPDVPRGDLHVQRTHFDHRAKYSIG